MTAKPKVKIHVKSKIESGGQTEESAFAVLGEWVKKGDARYLTYGEPLEHLGNTRTTLRISETAIRLVRFGDVRMNMEFRQGETTRGSYETLYGTLSIEVTTHSRRTELCDQKALLEWSYDLHMNGEKQGTYRMEVRVQEEEE
jgi:uncharacterized beta-barrel protein YwiB (DUF1934 family)